MMNMKPDIPRVLLPAVAFAVVLSGCGDGQAKLTDEDESPAIPVEVIAVERGAITAFYSTTATLEADREARVVPRLGGTIVELLVEEGDFVEEGQVLARIDDDRYRIEVARIDATLRRMEQDFNRHREMHARDLISVDAFERAKFDFEAQQAQAELARLELSHTAIRAPITGVVSRRDIKVGNTVNTQDPAFVITSMDPLLATLHVPERELARLAAGQQADILIDALPGRNFNGHIARISPVVDPATGTFRATVEVRGDNQLLKPGMFGRVNIVHDTRDDVLLVPVQAVMVEDARASVFVVNDGSVERRVVRLGYRNNGQVEIASGLEDGDVVVVTGQAGLRHNSRVQVIAAAEAG